MEIKLRNYGKDYKLMKTKSSDIKTLLIEISINPETVIVRLNSEVVTHDVKFKAGDEIEIIPIVSGG